MHRRPWPLVLLAILQLFTPFISLLTNSWIIGVTPWVLLSLFWEFHSAWRLLSFLGLPVLAAIAVYAMRRWSYPIFFSICAWSTWTNFRDVFAVQNPWRTATILISSALNLAFVGYFLIPAVRAAYFNPRLRWWESKPRYKLSILGMLQAKGGPIPFASLDLSEGGMFVKTLDGHALQIGQKIGIHFSFYGMDLKLHARVVHHSPIDSEGYGLQFVQLNSECRGQLHRLAQALALLSVQERHKALSWRADLREWFSRLLRSGRGWVPELPARPVKKTRKKGGKTNRKAA